MNFVSLIRSDYSATSAGLIVDFTFVSVRDASKFSLGIRSRLGSGLGLDLLEKIFRAPVYGALRGHLCDSTAFLLQGARQPLMTNSPRPLLSPEPSNPPTPLIMSWSGLPYVKCTVAVPYSPRVWVCDRRTDGQRDRFTVSIYDWPRYA